MKIKSTHRWLSTTVFAVTIALLGISSGHGNDPDALWKLVHDKCVPDQRQNDERPVRLSICGRVMQRATRSLRIWWGLRNTC
jgi:CDP-diacylglycerol pyrophosphatase